MTVRPVLVATDLSARSDRAIDRALSLAREWECRASVLHVLAHPEAGPFAGDRQALLEELEAVLPMGEQPADCVLREGSPPAEIVGFAEQADARMIVMAPARFNSLSDYILGTALDWVLRHTVRPVLVVKKRPRQPYRTIIAGTDFSSASRHAIQAAMAMFPQASFHLVHAFQVPYESWNRADYVAREFSQYAEEEMQGFVASIERASGFSGQIESHVLRGGLCRVLNDSARRLGADLAVLGTHGQGLARQILLGASASEALRMLALDSLLVHPKWEG